MTVWNFVNTKRAVSFWLFFLPFLYFNRKSRYFPWLNISTTLFCTNFSYRQLFVSRLMHWQFIGNFLPKWVVSDAIKIPKITLHLNKHCCQLRQDKTDLERNIWSEYVCAGKTLRLEIKNCSITKCHFSSIFALWPFFYGLSFLWRHFFCWMEIGAWCSMQNLAKKFVSLHYLYTHIFFYLLTAKAVCFFD